VLAPYARLLAVATTFAGALPYRGDVIGSVRTERVSPGDSLIEMARRFDLGFGEIEAANRGIDAFVPPAGASVVLPTAWIVPDLAAGEILVNLSEMRLYLLLPDGGGDASIVTFPVGIGVEGATTPPGRYRVVEKELQPTWHVPPSVRREEPDLPPAVPPGPDNPLGTHALRLDRGHILIHGTNRPFGVGRRVSHGCIRLYPEDIPVLFGLVPVGARVRIVREPVKVGLDGGRVHVEVHRDREAAVGLLQEARRLLAARGLLDRVDPAKLRAEVRRRTGVPVDVGR